MGFRNIFLTDNDHIVLGDLGIARKFNDDTTSLTTNHIGTYKYMSPEIMNNNEYTYETDIW